MGLGIVWTFLKGLSPRTWLYIGIAVAIAFTVWRGISWYNGQIDAAEKRGALAVETRIEVEAKKITKAANEMAEKARRLSDENARLINNRADDLRLRGAGKATCTNVYSASSSGYESPSGTVSTGLPGVSEGERIELIGMRTDAAIEFAENADLNRNEVLSWRQWYKDLKALWEKSSK